ncbi:ComF family protein [Actinocorallia sp. A-T 12471]|uniref:ComF family protein n=1 Tax=Actinocorallia sp. A-T 12471 TaxID=3089813 RepID=UPI0029CF8911|nr:phosphoribosyltransferase family protein [Actinocorallia sp. A-T 12471]MDX6742650.1 phosphoribosyltransferase family protein [Actinocorallia sp. A-T 12471]
MICARALTEEGSCTAETCATDRRKAAALSSAAAIGSYTGLLAEAIRAFKYPGHPGRGGFAEIFGRVIVGWLWEHADVADDLDLIVVNPTEPNRAVPHTELLLSAIKRADPEGVFPVDDPESPVLRKTRPTIRSHGRSRVGRREAAEAHCEALEVDVNAILYKRLLIVDDVLTTGSQLREVSRLLVRRGAERVRGLVLARTPDMWAASDG